MKWFRFYSEVLHDAKIQTLPVELRWAWVSILCIANEGKPRGVLPPTRDVAFALRTTEKKAQSYLTALTDAGLIDDSPDVGLMPHNWTSRQLRGDDAASIKRNQRDKKKSQHGQSNDKAESVPGQNVDGPPDVHGQSSEESTECPSLEREGEGERESPPPPVPVSNSPESVVRTAARAEELFPTLDYGPKVRQLHTTLRMDWLDEALRRTHAQGKRRWDYIMGTYRGIEADGGVRPRPNGRPPAPLEKSAPAHPIHVEPPDSKFAKLDKKNFKHKQED